MHVVNDSIITCVAPAGTGKDLSVSVVSQQLTGAADLIFSYEPPTVFFSSVPPMVGGNITITGVNFGINSTAVVTLGDRCIFSLFNHTRYSFFLTSDSG